MYKSSMIDFVPKYSVQKKRWEYFPSVFKLQIIVANFTIACSLQLRHFY